jgi:hypothetical protein
MMRGRTSSGLPQQEQFTVSINLLQAEGESAEKQIPTHKKVNFFAGLNKWQLSSDSRDVCNREFSGTPLLHYTKQRSTDYAHRNFQ